MADGILKTMPNTGTYFPPKIMVDGRWRYIVGITEWHDHEHDAREAHRLRALLTAIEAAASAAVLAYGAHAHAQLRELFNESRADATLKALDVLAEAMSNLDIAIQAAPHGEVQP